MKQGDLDALKTAIQSRWSGEADKKTERYLCKFFDRTRTGKKIVARVVGNHGTYTASIEAKDQRVNSACSCYIGRDGYCHHCRALAFTFLNEPESFKAIKQKRLNRVRDLDDLESYLEGKTLDSLLQDLKAKGITQKAFAESIGMSTRHLSSIKSSELRHHYYNELGATKLACLWVLEHIEEV